MKAGDRRHTAEASTSPSHPERQNTCNTEPPSPLAALNSAILTAGFHADRAQQHAANQLEVCHAALHTHPTPTVIRGVYLWGPVGRGKTWLLDAFYRSLRIPARRQHFHHFMQWVHRRQFQLTGTPDPLRALARELARDIRVLCFDELFVSDIADAMLLGTLFQALFSQGVVIVATSNQAPQQLYADGFNRQRFLPAIQAIEKHMQIVAVDGDQDHRLHGGPQHQRYFVRPNDDTQAFNALFNTVSNAEACSFAPIVLGSRMLECVAHTERILWCRFGHLCGAPLSTLDFIALCDRFAVIMLSEVPALGGQQRPGNIARGTEDGVEQIRAGDRVLPALAPNDDSVRRFIALVDECYDRGVPLYIEADVPLTALYAQGYLEFAFRRTLSRLSEMQFARFSA